MALGLLAVGCVSPAATPIVIYVTPPPATAAPTIVVTAPPTAPPTPSARPSPTPESHTLYVQVTLYATEGNGLTSTSVACQGEGGYADIAPGMQATIKDSNGSILGVGTFSDYGKPVTTGECQFTTDAGDIPERPFYSVDLGRRGSVQFALSDLQSNGWVAGISIGP
jgi:hypothetical protein